MRATLPGSGVRRTAVALAALSAAGVCAGLRSRIRSVGDALEESEQRARAVLDTAVDAIITIDAGGRIGSVNQATERLFGYAAAEMLGQNVCMLMPEPERSAHDQYLRRYAETGERHVIGIGRQVSGRRRDGTVFPLELAVSEFHHRGNTVYTGMLRDVSERQESQDQLARQALHDPLTGLGNRARLLDRLDHALGRLDRRRGTVALIYADIDDFKGVNDSFGHAAGDELLRQVADRLRVAVRPEDTLARIGGDEFVVLCEDLPDSRTAMQIALRVSEALTRPFLLERREILSSGSVGVATADRVVPPGDLLRDADAAMYAAKGSGRSHVALFDEGMRARAAERMQLRSALHQAIPRGQLRVHYQPIVDLATGRVRAVEALVRWMHPEGRVREPDEFLPAAADAGLLPTLDSWVLRDSCRQAALWQKELDEPVAVWVNLSAVMLGHPHLVDLVTGALEEAGLPPHLLALELTEGALMRDVATTASVLGRLRGLGVRLVVDGFGTGYSSLAYLRRFPVDAVKVDRSFVVGLDTDADNRAIVRAVADLAGALGLQAVVEGVETAAEMRAVGQLHFQLGQGFFLGRPADAERVQAAFLDGVDLGVGTGSVVG